LLPVLACGCGSTEEGYTFALVPRLIDGQQPFVDSPEVKLLIQHASGETEILSLGTAGSGDTVELGKISTIAAGSIVGVIAQTPGGAANEYDPSALVAYGQVAIEADLSTSADDIALEVFIPQAAAVGEMGRLPEKYVTFRGGLAMIPGGDALLFGGAGDDDDGTSRILRMSQTDASDWDFDRLSTSTPNIDGGKNLAGLTATTVMVDGSAQVFVAGGRPFLGNTGDNSTQAYLFDPVTEEVVWGTANKDQQLSEGRSDHRALRIDDGKVLLYGGYTGPMGVGSLATFELFDPADQRFITDTLASGSLASAAAGLGPDGAMVCGGTSRSGITSVPVTDCTQVSLSGVTVAAESLVDAVFGHAMAYLGDGQILATGGVLSAVDDYEAAAATASAWLYDGNSWTRIDDMALARAHHAMIPTPEGSVIIIGGVVEAGVIFPQNGEGPAVKCAELFDPATLSFEQIGGSCTNSGAGAHPAIASWPGEGAITLAGRDTAGEVLGRTYGFIGFGPDL